MDLHDLQLRGDEVGDLGDVFSDQPRAARATAESFSLAVPPDEAERRCRRALMEAWSGARRLPSSPASAGARIVVLDDALAPLPVWEGELGLPWNWRTGPASRPISDESDRAETFTPAGAGLRPFSVVHIERTVRSSGDPSVDYQHASAASP
jgi:hypothetical protein